jgi:chromosome segregation ATPase
MRWLLALALIAILALSVAWEAQRRAIQRVAEESERRALESVQKAREAVSADLQGLRESRTRLQQQIAVQAREVARLRTAAATAKKEVATVREAGDRLRSAPADEVIAEAARQGYTAKVAR